jgi:alcohol dehydrogenase (cytochrome c)
MRGIWGRLTMALCAVAVVGGVCGGSAATIDWQEVTDARLRQANQDGGNWLMHYRTDDGWRYSPLNQISAQNVAKLVPKWHFSLGEVGDQEAVPLVNNGVMIFPAGSTTRIRIFALDAANGGVLWVHERRYPADLTAYAVFHPNNRGVALYQDKVYFGTLDAKVVALDAKTGKVIWEKSAADYTAGYYFNAAPMIVKGKVVMGTSGPGEVGIRGFIQALNADTGAEVWKTWVAPAAGEPGSETWAGESWKYGGGAVWIAGTYDPETNLILFGTGNPSPFIWEVRRGDNLYTSSVIALDADTGQMKWYHQYVPNDAWDYDAQDAHLLINVKRDGQEVKAAMEPNKSGFLWTLDRTTGKPLAAVPYVKHLDWAKGYDLQTWKPMEVPGKRPAMGGPAVEVCPSGEGGRGWAYTTYSPQTNLLYIPASELCMSYIYGAQLVHLRGVPYVGAASTLRMPLDNAGVVRAIDVNTGTITWEWWNKAPLLWGGLLSTGGGLVFVGTWEGRLVALESTTGRPLWNFRIGTPVTAAPMTYAVGGTQYVAVIAGGKNRVLTPFSKVPKLAEDMLKVPLGGVLTVFGLPD